MQPIRPSQPIYYQKLPTIPEEGEKIRTNTIFQRTTIHSNQTTTHRVPLNHTSLQSNRPIFIEHQEMPKEITFQQCEQLLIPVAQRTPSLLATITALFQKATTEQEKASFFWRIYSISERERAEVLTLAEFFLPIVQDARDANMLLSAIKNSDPYARNSLLQKVEQVLPYTSELDDLTTLFPLLDKCSEEKVQRLMKLANPLLGKIHDGWELFYLFKELYYHSCFKKENLELLIQQTAIFLDTFEGGRDIAFLLDSLTLIPSDKRKQVLDKAFPLPKEVTDGWKISTYLLTLKNQL